MALKLDINFNGLEIKDAYVKVNSFEGDKSNLCFNVFTCLSRDSGPIIPPESYSCPYDLRGGNPLDQAYAYLKTLPKMEGFVDILEDGQII